MTTFLPININISNKRILIIGGGRVGLHKAQILSRHTTEATIISPTFAPSTGSGQASFSLLPFRLLKKEYEESDLEGAFLVYACTENPILNSRIKRDAEKLHILCSVCDNPSLCDFTSPAIFQDGDIMVAVSSNATDVRKSMSIRDSIRKNWKYLMERITLPKSLYH